MAFSSSNERATDQFVRDELRAIGFHRPWEQGGGKEFPVYLQEALIGASKQGGNGYGKPEFLIESGKYLVVIEDKKNIEDSVKLDGHDRIDLEYPAPRDYALNGAVHYARHIADKTRRNVFAVGVAGSESHNHITVCFVAPYMPPKRLKDADTLTNFASDKIHEYYRVAVQGDLPKEEREVKAIRSVAAALHEDMRNYANVEGERKATLVSVILLALKGNPDLLDHLQAKNLDEYPDLVDGVYVYNAAKSYLESPKIDLKPKQKIGAMLDQFAFIKTHVQLNSLNTNLGKTPMKRFVETLHTDVLKQVSNPGYTAFDVLGAFYGEFVKYGGSDGNALGIVLTPHHITELMAELIDIDSDDIVLDPAAGSASFLIAAMKRMFTDADTRYGKNSAKAEDVKKAIKRDHLHGIELPDKLFSIGTTTMILRGDGKANFQRHNFFDLDLHELRRDQPVYDDSGCQILDHHSQLQWEDGPGFTKVLINPPYSQAKTKETRHLSELSFVSRALDALNRKGRLAAIVPQSAMVGKTKEDKQLKAYILNRHTLDAVLTMNPDTFHGVGTHTVIALFTAGMPHPADKLVSFVNFKDDGYYVRQHVGLIDDGTADERRTHLMNVLKNHHPDETSFIVRTPVTATDEWQHSFFYFNDSPPTYEDFMETVADYLTWQIDMHTHGHGDIITPRVTFDNDEEA